jgi:hypothetical protein
MMEHAFPFPSVSGHPGMTLRDYFAGQALAGLLANNSAYNPQHYTRLAYQHADEMMKARAGG